MVVTQKPRVGVALASSHEDDVVKLGDDDRVGVEAREEVENSDISTRQGQRSLEEGLTEQMGVNNVSDRQSVVGVRHAEPLGAGGVCSTGEGGRRERQARGTPAGLRVDEGQMRSLRSALRAVRKPHSESRGLERAINSHNGGGPRRGMGGVIQDRHPDVEATPAGSAWSRRQRWRGWRGRRNGLCEAEEGVLQQGGSRKGGHNCPASGQNQGAVPARQRLIHRGGAPEDPGAPREVPQHLRQSQCGGMERRRALPPPRERRRNAGRSLAASAGGACR